jgi:hypothetical protein
MIEKNPKYDGLHVYKINVAKLLPGDRASYPERGNDFIQRQTAI